METFFREADIDDVELSPSGRRLAVTTTSGSPRLALTVVDLETGKAASVAKFEDADVGEFNWVNDDRLVFSSAGSAHRDRRAALLQWPVRGDARRQRLAACSIDLRNDFHRRLGAADANR